MNDTIVEKIEYLEYLESVYNESRLAGEMDFWSRYKASRDHRRKDYTNAMIRDDSCLYDADERRRANFCRANKKKYEPRKNNLANYKDMETERKYNIEANQLLSSMHGSSGSHLLHRMGMDNRSARKDRTKPVKSLADSYPSKKSDTDRVKELLQKKRDMHSEKYN